MNGISGSSSKIRLTGLSGFDTEQLVSDLMKAERVPLDTLRQKRTLVEWKQEAYREISASLKGFKSKYFDIVNRSTYMLSANSIKLMSAKSTNDAYVSATATADASAGAQTIKVEQIATADTAVSLSRISKDITGTVTDKALANKKIIVNLDGVNKEIMLDNYTDGDLESKLQAALDQAFGSSKINVDFDAASQRLTIGTINGATKVQVFEFDSQSTVLSSLGLVSGQSNRISLKSTLSQIKDFLNVPLTFSAGATVDITINGKVISASATDTLGQFFDRINNTAEAKAKISYDEITDKVTLASTQTGVGDNLALADINGNFFAAMGIDAANPVLPENEGKDAKIILNGTQTIIRSTNNFTVGGVNYTLRKAHDAASLGETITVEQDVDTVVKNIKSLIEDYNKMISGINGKLVEKYDRDYPPLTDEQKDSMKDSDIENWEKKAKTGLLRNDGILQQIVYSMRRALYEKVEGVSLTLKDIGIDSKSYLDNGVLSVDEEKLRSALKESPDQVAKLINGVSEQNPTYKRTLTEEQRKDRYAKSGLFQRLSDIIEDNISTMRNQNDKKGFLLEKAGIEGDASNTKNLLSDELEDYDDRIDAMVEKLIRKENSYYLKFSKLEQVLNKMNQQSAWLASQLGSSN